MKKQILILAFSLGVVASGWCQEGNEAKENSDATNGNSIEIRDANGKLLPTPLMIIDGQDFTKTDFENPNTIEIVKTEVFKGEEAIARYGNEGKNGVIVITTKAYAARVNAKGKTD